MDAAALINNGNRTEWSQIRSVRPRSGNPICLITSMITDRIGQHEVLFPINHTYNKSCDNFGFLKSKHKKFPESFLLAVKKKKPFKRARDGAYCPITFFVTVMINSEILLTKWTGSDK